MIDVLMTLCPPLSGLTPQDLMSGIRHIQIPQIFIEGALELNMRHINGITRLIQHETLSRHAQATLVNTLEGKLQEAVLKVIAEHNDTPDDVQQHEHLVPFSGSEEDMEIVSELASDSDSSTCSRFSTCSRSTCSSYTSSHSQHTHGSDVDEGIDPDQVLLHSARYLYPSSHSESNSPFSGSEIDQRSEFDMDTNDYL